jgi:hypothetical protein
MNRLTIYGFALSVAAVLGGFSPLPAQDADERARREEVARQETEQKIASLLRQAAARKDSKEALALLEQAAKVLKDSSGLGLTRRNELDESIQSKIKALKNGSSDPSIPPLPSGTGREDDFQAQLNTLNMLRKQGRDAEARVLAEKLNQQYPNRREAIMSRETTGMADQAKEQSRVQQEKRDGNRSAMNDVERANSNLPKDGVISYPPNFKEKMEKRKETFPSTWTAEEKALLRLLDTPTKEPVQFNNTPLDQVLKHLETNLGLSLQINEATLREVQADYSRQISVNIPKGTNRRAVLLVILGNLDLTYVIKNSQIVVMTPERASKEMVTKPYYVGELAGSPRQIADLIEKTIEPESWRRGGGRGHIVVHDKVLYITNTAEVISRIVPHYK